MCLAVYTAKYMPTVNNGIYANREDTQNVEDPMSLFPAQVFWNQTAGLFVFWKEISFITTQT